MNPKARRYPFMLYVSLFLGTIVVILIANMFFLSRQTKKDFIKMFWRQNGETAEFIALSASQAIESRLLSNSQINEHLKTLALQLDQTNLPLIKDSVAMLDVFREKHRLALVAMYDNKGQTVAQSPAAENLGHLPTLAWPRRSGVGVLMLSLGEEKTAELQEHLALEGLALTIKEKKIADYVSFIGPHRRILAHTDPSMVGTIESNEGIESSLKDKTTYYYRRGDRYEAVHPFKLSGDRWGAILIGLDSKEFDQIYGDIFENTAVFSAWVIMLATLVSMIVWRIQTLYFRKIESMQRQIAEGAKLVSLGNLAAGVAHEIRNPLNSISMTLQRLELEFAPEDSESNEEFSFLTQLTLGEVKRINRIVTDFLGFSKPYAPRLEPFDIQAWLGQIEALFSPSAKEKGVFFFVEHKGNDLEMVADQEKLHQVVLNLLGNALDASPEGSIIKLYSKVTTKQWEMQIIDQGAGIPRDKLAQIFDIYYTTKAHGTGLGLYICQKIIQAHHGQIELANNHDRGAIATLILPKPAKIRQS